MTKIPSFDCGTCTACCTVVPFTKTEKDRASERNPLLVWEHIDTGSEYKDYYTPKVALETMRCPFVKEGVGCTIYDIRPILCRLYGSVDHPKMTCRMGRGPTKRKIPHTKAQLMIRAEQMQETM